MRGSLLIVSLALVIGGELTVVNAAAAAHKPTECETKLGAPLKKPVREAFPELHVPRIAELDPDAVRYGLADGGDGCYVVATGDFTGDGRKSVAMILASADGKHGQLVAAVKTRSSWRLDKLRTYCGDVRDCYVDVLKPGIYTRTMSVDGPLQVDGELSELTTKTDSVVSGKLESTGVLFAIVDGQWKYVRISD